MADTSKILNLFQSDLIVINVGARVFGDAAEKQGCEVLQVDWQPPAGGDKKMAALLDELGF